MGTGRFRLFRRVHDSGAGTPEFRLGVILGFAVFLVLGLLLWPRLSRPAIVQPIQFNHALHVDAGLECVDCHPGVELARGPRLPRNEICADCHEEALTDSPEEARLIAYLSSGEQVPWAPLFRKASHVFFPHRRHVVVAGLECSNCHADMGQRTSPPSSPPMWLKMQDCLDCHTANEVPNDCTRCHR